MRSKGTPRACLKVKCDLTAGTQNMQRPAKPHFQLQVQRAATDFCKVPFADFNLGPNNVELVQPGMRKYESKSS